MLVIFPLLCLLLQEDIPAHTPKGDLFFSMTTLDSVILRS